MPQRFALDLESLVFALAPKQLILACLQLPEYLVVLVANLGVHCFVLARGGCALLAQRHLLGTWLWRLAGCLRLGGGNVDDRDLIAALLLV